MRHLLSNFFLVVFIFLFAVPPQLMAQNTWTPPTQPAVGGNTPSPINVSQFAQTKQGKLTVDGGFVSNTGSNLNGPTVLDVSPSQPNNSGYNLVFNFLKSYFLNSLQVGSEGSVGPEVKIVGQLKYKPTDSSGDIPDDSFIPQPGQVLKATDTEGTIAWGTAIPDGVNPGDTLIWDEICNCWTTGPGGGSGNLPPAEAGQTLWYNGDIGEWQATSKINHNDTTTNIDSDNLSIRGSGTEPGQGRIPYSLDAEGKFKWNENLRYQLSQGGVLPYPLGQLTLDNPEDGIGVFLNNGISYLADDVTVGEEADVYLSGLNSASLLEINQGLVKQLCYVQTTKKIVDCTTSTPSQSPSDNEISPVYDTDFEIIRTSANNPGNSGGLPTSYEFQSEQTITVEWCGGGGGGGGGGLGTYTRGGGGGGGGAAGECESQEIDVYPGDKLTWQIGEGGSAGIGGQRGERYDGTWFSTAPTDGGQGGTTTIFLQQGIADPVQIGSTVIGGLGGKRGVGENSLDECYNVNTTTGGMFGGDGGKTIREPETIPCDPDNRPSIISTLGSWHDGANGLSLGSWNGGNGGDGESPTGSIFQAYSNVYPTSSAGGRGGIEGNFDLGGVGGNTIIGSGTYTNRWGGDGGAGNHGFGGGGGGGSYGGGFVAFGVPTGGVFNHLDEWGYVVGINASGILATIPPDPFTVIGTFITTIGIADALNVVVYNNPLGPNHIGPNNIATLNKSSNGGKGGSGYVKISNLINAGGSTGIDFSTPTNSIITVPVSNIPSAVSEVTIEAWGGGGGGGGAKTGFLADRKAGGGGAGGYIKVQNIPRSELGTGNLLINVGAGGVGGISSGQLNNVTDGENGSNSFVKKSDGTMLVSASGGFGGPRDVSSSTDNSYPGGGAGGGVGGTAMNISGVTTTSVQGGSGGSGGAGNGLGGQNAQGGNINNGGVGAITSSTLGLSRDPGTGVSGRVKITWQ